MIEFAQRLIAVYPDLRILFTDRSETPPDLPAGMQRVPVPPDRSRQVRAFFDQWQPQIGLWTECDLRSTLLVEAHDRKIPLVMADAGTARPDARAWRWRKGTARGLLARFSTILAGSEETLSAMRRMSGDAVDAHIAGFMEEGPGPLPCDEAERDALATTLAGRPVWHAAGAPLDELDAIRSAGRQSLQRSHRALLLLSPANLDASDRMADLLRDDGWLVARRSRDEPIDRDTQVYLADTTGEDGLWYRLSPITFLANSLYGSGVRDPFAAASLGSAILHGPNTHPHQTSFQRLGAAGATRMVRTPAELSSAVETLLSPDVAASMAQSAWRVATSGAELTDRLCDLVLTTLEDRGAV